MKKEKTSMNPSLTDRCKLSQLKEVCYFSKERLLEPELIKCFFLCEYLEQVQVVSLTKIKSYYKQPSPRLVFVSSFQLITLFKSSLKYAKSPQG